MGENTTKGQELLAVRRFNRELLLAALDATNFQQEERSATTNIKSKNVICVALRIAGTLYSVGYNGYPYTSKITESIRSLNWQALYDKIMKAAEYGTDYHRTRELLIEAVRSMDVEQKKDLQRIMSVAKMSAFTSCEEIYNIQSKADVTWLPEDLKSGEGEANV